MNRLSFILFALLILGIGGGVAWYLVDTKNDARGVPTIATTTPEVAVGDAIYTNGTYGFTVFYPENAQVANTFDPSYNLGALWRANALPEGQGTPVVSFVTYSVRQENAYPRSFAALVRVGVSSDPKELARCEEAASEQGETMLPDTIISGRPWKTFSFESAGMMQYAQGVSYRTLYEGRCIALEKARTGSSYREEPSSSDIPDETLAREYEKLDAIIERFTLAR